LSRSRANRISHTASHTNGFHLNEPQIVARPDGTADIYQYGIIGQSTTNSTTNIVWTGHLDSSGTNEDAGTETISVLSATGQLLSRKPLMSSPA